MTIFFSADFHINHSRIIDYCNRPFVDISHMNRTIIDNLNKDVGRHDTLYYLGDFVFGTASDIEYYRSLINCQNIHFILGNHDDKIRNLKSLHRLFLSVSDIAQLKISNKKSIVMCHYPMYSWNGKKKIGGNIHLFGHSHGNFNGTGLSMDIGIDTTKNYTPRSLDSIIKIMKEKSDKQTY